MNMSLIERQKRTLAILFYTIMRDGGLDGASLTVWVNAALESFDDDFTIKYSNKELGDLAEGFADSIFSDEGVN